ncbi:MAG: BlaI/MecI/CopY family transcriptional regulator [Nonlabens sp.]|nr:BlaI/MecI/CopY family transcriptional regulator [Nonlabens sp.]
MKTLTTAEEEIMHVLWKLREANVALIIEQLPEPKPAYNTVSTIIRILESKEFVSYRKEGRGHIYYPSVSKADYTKATTTKIASNYFKGSFKSMVSFFMQQDDLTVKELEELLTEIKKKES